MSDISDISDIRRRTIGVLVDNDAGVLSQVSRLFSRKGYNIESLAVGTTEAPDISRITIEVFADDSHIELLCNQLRKLFPVHSVKLIRADQALRRELVLIKVNAQTSEARNEIIQIATVFRASVVDVSPETVIVSVIGEESKTDAFEKMLASFGILELVRTGVVALERGSSTITEETKEKGEFDYGKNVL